MPTPKPSRRNNSRAARTMACRLRSARGPLGDRLTFCVQQDPLASVALRPLHDQHPVGDRQERCDRPTGPEQAEPLSCRSSGFAAFFTISAAKARALLPSHDRRPVRVSARRALVLVQAMDYTEKNIAPYREFIFSIPVHRSRRADVPFLSSALWERLPGHGAYITHIAVNDESSRLIGREVQQHQPSGPVELSRLVSCFGGTVEGKSGRTN
ncbi:acetoacetate decarboxylase family protein [Streptomyces lutosisoli]|uniref:Acetoacetate decarboxylase family protein n=1 Tax=Streptomyces lutosisoli TaxID=2665721 RepID=A0ABW2VTY5_9ACTN